MMSFRIGQLAKAAEVNIETIRYYERRGLIVCPAKPETGYRQYSENDLQRLLFIKRAKLLGFKLEEVQNLLTLPERQCADVQLMAQKKLDQIQLKINDLQRLEVVLQGLLKQCDSLGGKAHCPIIESLLHDK